MRSDRRATRNRVYSLVGAGLGMAIMITALATLRFAGEKKIADAVYPFPSKVLLALCEAQERFRMRDLDGDGERDYAASLRELAAAGCITDRLATGEVRGYRYELRPEGAGWAITATPVAPIDSASLAYWVDARQIVTASAAGPAARDSAEFWSPLHGDVWTGGRPPPAGGPLKLEPEAQGEAGSSSR